MIIYGVYEDDEYEDILFANYIRREKKYMSKADEMFEELGYKLTDEKICPHSYRYSKNISRFDIKEIIIEKANKLITICYYKVDVHGCMEAINSIEYHLSLQELQAINEKCRELGWIE